MAGFYRGGVCSSSSRDVRLLQSLAKPLQGLCRDGWRTRPDGAVLPAGVPPCGAVRACPSPLHVAQSGAAGSRHQGRRSVPRPWLRRWGRPCAAVPRAGRRFVRTACASKVGQHDRAVQADRVGRDGFGVQGERVVGAIAKSKATSPIGDVPSPPPGGIVARRADDQVGAPVEQGVPAARQDFQWRVGFRCCDRRRESGDHREQALGRNQRIDGDAQFGLQPLATWRVRRLEMDGGFGEGVRHQ